MSPQRRVIFPKGRNQAIDFGLFVLALQFMLFS